MRNKVSVLFVCMGNICRSPMAEAVFAHLVHKAKLEAHIDWDSAGTGHWHVGEEAHPQTMKVLQRHNISYMGVARQLQQRDLDDFDYIVTMDNENLRAVKTLGAGAAHVAPLMSYAPHLSHREVPDPYYEGGFDDVYVMVEEGCKGLLKHIRRHENL